MTSMMQARSFSRASVVLALSFGFLSAGASASVEPDPKRIIPPPPLAAEIILAQDNGEEPGPGPGMTTPESNGGSQPGFGSGSTNEIILSLQAGEGMCSWLPFEYRIDCLAQAYRLTANLARERPAYLAVSTALQTASRDLSRLVSQNADPAAPRVRSHGRTYRAVRPEAVASVTAQAEAIITETETKLLRSTGSVGQAHYQRIAQAVGSSKRILRS